MPMSYSTPKPRRWPSDLRGTDANSGDGWVGSLSCGIAFRSWSKSGPRHSAFEPRVRTPMLAPPYRSCRCYYTI